MATSPGFGSGRLGDAVSAFLRRPAADDPTEREAFLAKHEHLRDLLEPMFEDDEQDYGGETEGTDATERRLGEFRLIGEIGRGGMGVVYEAWQPSLERRVALKVLPAHLTLQQEAVVRFEREARLAAGLEHPGIVDIYEVGSQDGTHWFAMDLIEGAGLDELLEKIRAAGDGLSEQDRLRLIRELLQGRSSTDARGQRDPNSAPGSPRTFTELMVELTIEVAAALAHAHAAGVIHRDVKPSNIIVRANGRPVLTDFGLAKDTGLPSLTMTGEFAGTPHYVSPEQALARRAIIDHRTDVYSLGATMYEALTLRVPHDGDSIQEIFGKIIREEPEDPTRISPHLAPDLAAIVLKALEKEPSRRYASMDDFAADLRAFLAYRPVQARRLSGSQRLLRWLRREPLKAGLAASLLLGVPALTGLGGYLLAVRPAIATGESELARRECDRLLTRAFMAHHESDYETALVRFGQARELAPDDPEALAGTAFSLCEVDRVDEALRLVRGAHDPRLKRAEAYVLWRLGDPDQARRVAAEAAAPGTPVEFVLRAFEHLAACGNLSVREANLAYADLETAILRSPRARLNHVYHLVHAAAHSTDADRAAASVAILRSLWPDLPDLPALEAQAWTRADPARSLALLDRGASGADGFDALHTRANRLRDSGRCEESIELLQRLAVDYPTEWAVWETMSLAYGDLSRDEEALRSLREAIRVRGSATRKQLGILADRLMGRGEVAEALRIVEKAIATGPALPELHRARCDALTRLGRHDEALDSIAEAIAGDPTNAHYHVVRGDVLSSAGRTAEALESLYRALALDEGNARAHVALGKLYARDGRKDLARSHLQAAEPRAAAGNWTLHNNLGFAYWLLDDSAKAEPWYRRAAEARPDVAFNQNNLGQALRDLQRFAEARERFEAAVSLDSQHAAAWKGLCSTLRELGENEQALVATENWAKAMPGHTPAWIRLAEAHMSDWVPTRNPDRAFAASLEAVRTSGEQDVLAWFVHARAAIAVERLEDARAAIDRCRAMATAAKPADQRFLQRNLDKLESGLERR